jgi:hypothetical protein
MAAGPSLSGEHEPHETGQAPAGVPANGTSERSCREDLARDVSWQCATSVRAAHQVSREGLRWAVP